jgi:hypothetical protein
VQHANQHIPAKNGSKKHTLRLRNISTSPNPSRTLKTSLLSTSDLAVGWILIWTARAAIFAARAILAALETVAAEAIVLFSLSLSPLYAPGLSCRVSAPVTPSCQVQIQFGSSAGLNFIVRTDEWIGGWMHNNGCLQQVCIYGFAKI